jgi:hypothetical protein
MVVGYAAHLSNLGSGVGSCTGEKTESQWVGGLYPPGGEQIEPIAVIKP